MPQSIWAYRPGAFSRGSGWDAVVSLPLQDNLVFLLQQLHEAELEGQISRLAIVAHGDAPGVVNTNPPMNQRSIFENPRVCGPISDLRTFLTPTAEIQLVACYAAAEQAGSNFLSALSTFWPGRTVVGYVTSGEIRSAYFIAGDVFDTGMRISGGTVLNGLSPQQLRSRRMTPRAQSAKWARDGSIVRQPSTPFP